MLKRIAAGASALVLSISSLFVLAPMIASAAVDACTWNGSVDDLWSNADNWDCATDTTSAPGAGDSLIFPQSAAGTTENDLTNNISFTSITFSGAGPSGNYTLSGNGVTLTSGLTNTSTLTSGGASVFHTIDLDIVLGSNVTINTVGSLYLAGTVSGSGDITKTGSGSLTLSGDNTFTGDLTVSAGTLEGSSETSFGTTAGSTTIGDGVFLNYYLPCGTDSTVNEPFNFNSDNVMTITAAAQGYCDDSIELAGDIVLGADVTVETGGTVTVTGALSGDHTIELVAGSQGTLVINSSNNTSNTKNGKDEAEKVTVKYDKNSPTVDVFVTKNVTAVVTGTYNNIYVQNGGILKGNGKFKGIIAVSLGGTIAPGMSPGCLTAGENFSLSGEYQVEIGGDKACSGYDQIQVTGTVTLKGESALSIPGTISASIINKYKLTKGQKFTIIDNDGKDKVVGTFKNLDEGATFKTASGTVLKVSYKGGSGNDVTLTVVTVGTPDTGFGLLLNNPASILVATTIAAGAILLMNRRMKFATKKSRR